MVNDCPECECCAIGVCCPDAAARAEKLSAAIAKATGVEVEYCRKFFAWMTDKQLVFAPASFQQAIHDVARIARKHVD